MLLIQTKEAKRYRLAQERPSTTIENTVSRSPLGTFMHAGRTVEVEVVKWILSTPDLQAEMGFSHHKASTVYPYL